METAPVPSPSSSPLPSPRAARATAPSQRRQHALLSPTKPTLHLSPRKFHAIQQQQRAAVLRGMLPLSPLSPRHPPPQQRQPNDDPLPFPRHPLTWNPAWLPFPVESVGASSPSCSSSSAPARLTLGSMTLDQWLAAFDADVLAFESLDQFAQVKLPEALAFCDKMEKQIHDTLAAERALRQQQSASSSSSSTTPWRRPMSSAMMRFPVRFRVAVFASLVERTVLAMTQSGAMGHLRPWLLQARQELFRAVFADYDDYPRASGGGDGGDDDPSDSNSDRDASDDEEETKTEEGTEQSASPVDRFGPEAPRSLNFFLSRVPFVVKMHDDTQRRTARFQRHQVVLRRIVQSLYRSLGTVFHAWKHHVQRRKEERLHDKGAQLTAMVVMQRGLMRAIFVEWSKCALKSKLAKVLTREAHSKKTYDDRVGELYRELFLVKEENARLREQLEATQRRAETCEEGVESDDEDDNELG